MDRMECNGKAGSRGEERETCMTEEYVNIMWEVTDVFVLCQLVLFAWKRKPFEMTVHWRISTS